MPEIGELNAEKVAVALAKVLKLKAKNSFKIKKLRFAVSSKKMMYLDFFNFKSGIL